MKRIFCFLIPLLLCVCMFGCADRDKSVNATITGEGAALIGMTAPPLLTVTDGSREIQTGSGTCVWNRGGIPIYADGEFVFDLWLGGELKPLTVSPDIPVELRFEVIPDRVEITAWNAECATGDRSRVGESFDLPVLAHTFRIPIDAEYLYEIAAEWDEADGYGGEAIYAFATVNGIE